MKAKYIITKIGHGKKVILPGSKVVLDDKTTQKDLKKLHGLGFTNLVKKEDVEENKNTSENATD